MKKLEIIKRILEKEYIYIYQNDKVYLDLYNSSINKDGCCGTIKTTINSSNNYYIIEVDKNGK